MTNLTETKTPIKVVLGTMEFGREHRESTSSDVCQDMVEYFVADGSSTTKADRKLFFNTELDTAVMYSEGNSEKIIGQILAKESLSEQTRGVPLRVASKANPWTEGLTPESMRKQITTSLTRMGVAKLDLFYLHAPDHKTPIEVTLEAVNKMYQEGLFDRFGLSNYAAWQVAQICEICRAKGYIMPTVYQGMYNALTRDVERELIPCLRQYKMAFYAYSPLAGGMLTGRYRYSEKKEAEAAATSNPSEGSRFFGNSWAASYQDRFWRENFFQSIDAIAESVKKVYGDEVSLAEASTRWLLHHSKMDGNYGDAVLIGASKMSHLESNLKYCAQGPLDSSLMPAFEEAWVQAKDGCPSYFR